MPAHEGATPRGDAEPAPSGDLDVTVDQQDGRVTVSAVGEVDLATVGLLRAALAGRLGGRQDLVVDLSRVTFIDSAGLHLLLAVRDHALRGDTSLCLVPGERVARVLDVSGMTDLFAYAVPGPAAPA